MIKNLKLNIKNNQLAEVLQKQSKAEESEPKVKKRVAKAPVAVEPAPEVDEEAKPKAQIIRRAKTKEAIKEEESAVEKSAPLKGDEDLAQLSKPVFRDESAPVLETKVQEPVASVAEPAVPQEAPAPAPVRLGPKLGLPSSVASRPSSASQECREERRDFQSSRPAFDGPRKPFDGPRKPYDGPRKPYDGPKKPYDGPRKPYDGPRKPYDGPRKPFETRPEGSRGDSPRQDRPYLRPEGGLSGPRSDDRMQRPRPPRALGSGFQDRGPRPMTTGLGGDEGARRDSRPPMGSSDRRPLRIRESFSDRQARSFKEQQERFQQQQADGQQGMRPRLGPTGKHFRDLVPQTPPADMPIRHADQEKASRAASHSAHRKKEERFETSSSTEAESPGAVRNDPQRTFDRNKPSKGLKKSVDRPVLNTSGEDEGRWRKKRAVKKNNSQVDETIRPSSLLIHLPITVKDLAQEMKLKASQLIAKLFMQGVAVTLNDVLDDETTVQLLGQEFGCEITIDRSEDERLQITAKTVAQEITESESHERVIRSPVVAFMGHVDHGKTSLIDAIRQSNRVAGEAGAITQHIGAFSCQTNHGPLTVLDTPGHEAFAAMRERGAAVTDVIVLVIAGDEGIKPQTDEAIRHARSVNATILVAINKCDKPNFNVDNVYRQLADRELLPEAWGGTTVTVNCSAVTGEGIDTLLEMVALQAEVLELTANPGMRARGTVIEAELHKGLGNVATVLVQNGTLRHGDALVFTQSWGRVKTMKDEFGKDILEAAPSHAARITGLSSLPEAGENFIVVASEREAREIAEDRAEKIRQKQIQTRKKVSMEAFMQQSQAGKKTLHCILRADVQGSVEALRFELLKVHSDKVDINIINQGIGEISESDVELASASGAFIIGFHTRVEAHAEGLIKALNVKVKQFDVIYHAVDGVKEMMAELLDKIAEEHYRGRIEVKTTFKSSQMGKIAGCQVLDGLVHRSHRMRVIRDSKTIWEGSIASLRRGKDDVKEIAKGFECGVLLNGFSDFEPGDILEGFEIVYRAQSL